MLVVVVLLLMLVVLVHVLVLLLGLRLIVVLVWSVVAMCVVCGGGCHGDPGVRVYVGVGGDITDGCIYAGAVVVVGVSGHC